MVNVLEWAKGQAWTISNKCSKCVSSLVQFQQVDELNIHSWARSKNSHLDKEMYSGHKSKKAEADKQKSPHRSIQLQ